MKGLSRSAKPILHFLSPLGHVHRTNVGKLRRLTTSFGYYDS